MDNNAGFDVVWAKSADDVRDAQQLRYRVFAHELGAALTPPAGTAPGLDADHFDPFCDHLLVRAKQQRAGSSGEAVGTYRVLSLAGALRAGGLYTDGEFDLAPLDRLRSRAVELGRSCVHPGWRSGGVILAMWSALVQHMLDGNFDTMIGCAIIGLHDGGYTARALWSRLRLTHLADAQWHVTPRTPVPANYTANYSPTGWRAGNAVACQAGILLFYSRISRP